MGGNSLIGFIAGLALGAIAYQAHPWGVGNYDVDK